jgi:hypothetical protein
MPTTTTKLVTAREFFSKLENRTLYMAEGPENAKSLLARATAEDAERDGLAYLLATRRQDETGKWVIK